MTEQDPSLPPELAQDTLSDSDDTLAPPPPIDDPVRSKKKLPLGTKLGFAAVGTVVVIAAGIMVLGGGQTPSGQVAPSKLGSAHTPGESKPGAPTDNPEIAALAQKATVDAALEAQEKGQSFVAPTTFGGSDPATAQTPPPAADLPPAPLAGSPPPPPLAEAAPAEDPLVGFFSNLIEIRRTVAQPGVFPGAQPAVAAAGMGPGAAPGNATPGGPASAEQGEKLANIGDIVYATLKSGLNSRVPQTPVRAQVHGGRLNGAILVGNLSVAGDSYLVLSFTGMNFRGESIPVQAVAVSAETQEAGLADQVKRHTFEKFVWTAGTGLLQGLGTVLGKQNTTSTTIVTPQGDQMTTSNNGAYSSRELAVMGAGAALTSAQPLVDEHVSRLQTEIIVAPNKEIGIVFMAPVFMPVPGLATR